jgi:Na+-translocating ferredoxin:NAD+ oxidoreductase RnfG subunit
MSKKGILIIAIIAVLALITASAAFILNFFEQPPPEIVEEGPHSLYLKKFLADTGLTYTPAVRNNFAYYELHTADEQLAGFVFLGTEEGWGGPINLYVKTDAAGIIQRVHVWHHLETPIYVVGLEAYLATFAGYRAEAQLVWQEDVHGITGATVTAEAIIAAVRESGQTAYQKGIFIRRGK